MTSEHADEDGRPKPANDNHAPDGEVNAGKSDAAAQLDTVVLSIARLIGRQLAREHFEALRADNDNRSGAGGASSSESDDDA